MRVVTYNIHYATGLDGRRDTGRIVNDLGEADVYCLQEVGRNLFGTLHDDVEDIAARLGCYSVFSPSLDLAMPTGTLDRAARQQLGVAILSRTRILDHKTIQLPGPDVSVAAFDLRRVACQSTVLTDVGLVRVVTAHLSHLGGPLAALQVGRLMAELSTNDPPFSAANYFGAGESWDSTVVGTVIGGDFNFTPSAPEYDAVLRGWAEWAEDSEGLLDAFAGDDRPTFTAEAGAQRLDYVFHTGGLRVERVDLRTAATGSDHLPIVVDFAAAQP
jgi:endonuclease/exonuclease/phosphatase family metal-dependent hydrolase